MFKPTAINHKRNLDRIVASGFKYQVTRRVFEQMNLIVGDVKLTFFQYPFPVIPEEIFGNVFRMPSLLSLAAMKAYALGHRSKWKDYVDLYFLLTRFFKLREIADQAIQPKFLISIYQFMLYLTQRCGEAEFAEFIPIA